MYGSNARVGGKYDVAVCGGGIAAIFSAKCAKNKMLPSEYDGRQLREFMIMRVIKYNPEGR